MKTNKQNVLGYLMTIFNFMLQNTLFSERRGRRKKTGHEENDIKEKERGDVIELEKKKKNSS